MIRSLLSSAAVVLCIAAGWAVMAYVRDIDRAYARLDGSSALVSLPDGQIEFTQGGSGPHVLVVHGSGGGFDQGELIAQAVLGSGFHWIAPSRFGYLRSTLREGATFDDQAHAYAHLLDQLGIGRVAVVALSHGGPSALLFAALHPDRVSSLTLLSCGVASSADPAQAQANQKGNTLTMLFKHDPLYWAVSTLLRGTLTTLLGADKTAIAGLSAEQRQLVDQIIDGMNPVALRSAGVQFDNAATMPNERIAAIRAPTLVIHAKDDSLQLYRNAEFAARTIAGARLHGFDSGGHLLIALQQEAVRAEVQQFILASAGKSAQ